MYRWGNMATWVQQGFHSVDPRVQFFGYISLIMIVGGIYHHPKGTTISKIVVDFQGITTGLRMVST